MVLELKRIISVGGNALIDSERFNGELFKELWG